MNEIKNKIEKKTFQIAEIFDNNFLPSKRAIFFILLAIFALAFSLRFIRSFQIERVEKDGVQLLLMAENIAKRGLDEEAFSENPRLPPLYILLLSVGIKLGISSELTGILISATCGALLIFPVFFIGRAIFHSFTTAMISALLIAIYPNLARLGANVLRDPLFQLLCFVGLWMLIEGIKSKKITFYCLAGASIALATATRNEGIELIFALVLFLVYELFFPPYNKDLEFHIRLKQSVLVFIFFVLAFVVSSLPLVIITSKTKSEWQVIDHRIPSFIRSFLSYPKSEIDKKHRK